MRRSRPGRRHLAGVRCPDPGDRKESRRKGRESADRTVPGRGRSSGRSSGSSVPMRHHSGRRQDMGGLRCRCAGRSRRLHRETAVLLLPHRATEPGGPRTAGGRHALGTQPVSRPRKYGGSVHRSRSARRHAVQEAVDKPIGPQACVGFEFPRLVHEPDRVDACRSRFRGAAVFEPTVQHGAR